jgi:hypothetical protein
MWQQLDQIWAWLGLESDSHPFLFLGIAIVIVSAWILYKAEIKTK